MQKIMFQTVLSSVAIVQRKPKSEYYRTRYRAQLVRPGQTGSPKPNFGAHAAVLLFGGPHATGGGRGASAGGGGAVNDRHEAHRGNGEREAGPASVVGVGRDGTGECEGGFGFGSQ